jgi:PhnB protein
MTVTAIEPELWVDGAAAAVDFYTAAFGASTLMRVGDGEDIVARLEVGAARFWVAPASAAMARLSPRAIDGRTSRTLLVVDDPDALVSRAVGAGATLTTAVGEEHGWRVGRIVDPYGHEWEIGRPPV